MVVFCSVHLFEKWKGGQIWDQEGWSSLCKDFYKKFGIGKQSSHACSHYNFAGKGIP